MSENEGETLDTSVEWVQLPAREYEALVAALRALCEDRPGKLPAGIADYDDEHYCIYCEKFDVYEPQQHKPDCAIRVARALLAGWAHE